MFLFFFFYIFSQISASEDALDRALDLHGDILLLRLKAHELFADPLTVYDCTGRSTQKPLNRDMDLAKFLLSDVVDVKIENPKFEKGSKLVYIMKGDSMGTIDFEAEWMARTEKENEESGKNGSYIITGYRRTCSAIEIAEQLNKMLLNIDKTRNITGILSDPYQTQECEYKVIPYSHKSLIDENKFRFRTGIESIVQKAEFESENVLKYQTKERPLKSLIWAKTDEFEYLAVRNETDGVFEIRKEFKMC